MDRCDSFQSQLLEHLYDLLEPEESRKVQEHLEGCPACQAALAHAKAQQGLIAAAARLEFQGFQFQVPAGAASGTAKVVPAPDHSVLTLHHTRSHRNTLRWAIAASFLLVFGGLSIAGIWVGLDVFRQRQIISQTVAELAKNRETFEQAVQSQKALPEEQNKKLQALTEDIQQRGARVAVTGPNTIQPGARNEFQIRTTDFNNAPVDAEVVARLVDEKGQRSEPIAARKEANGLARLVLPADLPAKPDKQLGLVFSARRPGGKEIEFAAQLPIEAPVFITHIATDKPMYQPGETVHFRSLTLDRFSLKPAAQDFRFVFTITKPTGEETPVLMGSNALTRPDQPGIDSVKGPDGNPVRGIGAGEFPIDLDAPGGEYTLTVREEQNRFPQQQRKFIVNRYQKPRLDKELDFNRTTFGPGDEVQAQCKAVRAGGVGPVANRPVSVTVQIDGQTYGADGKPSPNPLAFQTDADGRVTVRFKLPDTIERGEATVAVQFDDGGGVETLVKPIPILLKKLRVEFFPEGGDLVAGVPNRVYLQAFTPLGKPADLKGRLLEDGKPIDVVVETLHDDKEPGVNHGSGRFEFTPKARRKYSLQIDSPVGITQQFDLPAVEEDGVALRTPEGVIAAGGAIPVVIQSAKPRSLMVGAYCRGRLLDSVHLEKGQTEAVLHPATGAGGVYRITVFEEIDAKGKVQELKPVAERLVYRHPSENVRIEFTPDRSFYVPGQKVKLGVEAFDETGKKAPALIMLAVVDKSVVTLADEKTARAMPSHFLLTTEVKKPEDLEYADFLLGSHPKAALALDLLLGTQGWRRFAEQQPAKFRRDQATEADRLLVAMGQSEERTTDLTQAEFAQVGQDFHAKGEQLASQIKKAREVDTETRSSPALLAARERLASYSRLWENLSHWVPLAGAAFFGVVGLIFLAMGLMRFRKRVVPFYGFAGVCAAFVALFATLEFGGHIPGERQVAELLTRNLDPMREEAIERELDLKNFAFGMDKGAVVPGPAGPGGMANANGHLFFRKGGIGGGGFGGAPQPEEGMARLGALRPEAVRAFAAPQARAMDAAAGGEKAALRKELAANRVNGFADREAKDMKKADGAKGEADGRRMAPRALGRLQAKRLALADEPIVPPLPMPMVVREYAHQHKHGTDPTLRSDFTETVYWHPVLVLPDGKAEVSFDLSDSVSSYQITAFANTLDGRLGAATRVFDARLPFTLQPKTPIEATSSDTIEISVAVSNNTGEKRTVQVDIRSHDGLNLVKGTPSERFEVLSGSPLRRAYRFQPTIKSGEAELTFQGAADGFAGDAVRSSFKIVPEGFPISGSHSDLLEGSATNTITLPATWVPGTLQCNVQAFPSTLADLQNGLEGLLREPGGCFEQTSTSNYPNVLILDYLRETHQAKPEVEKRARDLLTRGYAMLTSFECQDPALQSRKRGYEWFGGTAPAHEALTAYGLMEFRDMARVHDVDAAMMKRTQEYLLSQRDGAGGFKRNPRALDTFGAAPQEITNAYIVWSLTEGGKDDDVSKELETLAKQAATSKDPYFLSLVANSLVNRARTAEGVELLKKVAALQQVDGHLNAERTSITGSGGRDLEIETTALAVLGWLKANAGLFQAPSRKAVDWIGKQRGGYGGFGSTQSTILALKAVIAFAKSNKRTAEAGELRLFVGDREVKKLAFKAGASETLALELPDAEKVLHAGKNTVRVEMSGKNVFPYSVAWSYRSMQPASAEGCSVRVAIKLAKSELREGDSVRLTVNVENVTDKGQGMAVAVIGLPGGLTVPEDFKQLKQHIRLPADGSRPLVSAFELRGRELVLYWRDLAPKQKIEVPIDLIARVPGNYSGPASRAYLYYNADAKNWIEPLKVAIAGKE